MGICNANIPIWPLTEDLILNIVLAPNDGNGHRISFFELITCFWISTSICDLLICFHIHWFPLSCFSYIFFRHPELGKKSRAFSSIPYRYQATTLGARKIVANYTLFRRALLPPGEVNKLVRQVLLRLCTQNVEFRTI